MITPLVVVLGSLGTGALILALRRFVVPLALAGATLSFLAAIATFTQVQMTDSRVLQLPGLPSFPFLLLADARASLLAMVVATVNLLVVIYAAGYMTDERDQARFFAELALFTGAMQILLLAGDWILFITAWEVIALASYLLIGFWFERSGVKEAATRAFLVTRGADLGLYSGAIILSMEAGTTRIDDTLRLGGTAALVAGVALLIAAIGKAAQVPLQGWLQDAMVGPTPVSALLHAATLVVAGVVLLLRVFPLLSPSVLLLVGLVGGVTALITGLTAVSQRDFKRLLASSTSSQLGFMFLAIGAGWPGAALFHLVTNAAIKSSLFLGAGIYQHTRGSTRFDALRGVGRRHRWVYAALAVAGLSLAGIPPLAGFWSKDAVFAATLTGRHAAIFSLFAVTGAVLTGVYVARALRLLWRGPDTDERSDREQRISGLTWMAVGFGWLVVLAAVLGLAEPVLERRLGVTVPQRAAALLLGLLAALLGLVAGWLRPADYWLRRLRPVAERGFRVGDGLIDVAVRPSLALARSCDIFDRGIHDFVLSTGHGALRLALGARFLDDGIHRVVDGIGALGLALAGLTRRSDEVGIERLILALVSAVRTLGGRARQLQTGLIYRELLLASVGALAILLVVVLTY